MSEDGPAIEQAIAQAQALQPSLNIFNFIEEATPTVRSGPLSGVPIAVKDLIDQAGRTTTCGSAFYRHEADTDAQALARLQDSGAAIIGRTGLHEFAFGFSSENPHFGPVRNPWDPATSPGGSSGGSAAAVAAGIVTIAIGTDTGGSVRVPAALCGCFGLKVSFGEIPTDGVFPLVPSIDTVGPIANSMHNIETSYRAMSGNEAPQPEPRRLRLGIPMPWFESAPIAEHVRNDFARAVARLETLGHDVHPLELPDVQPDTRLVYAIGIEAAPIHRQFRTEGLPYGKDVAERLDAADAVTDREAAAGREWQEMIRQRFSDAFDVVDLLITPTVPALRKVIGNDSMGDRHYRTVLSWFTSLVNHALLPALAMPLAGTGSPPMSLQAIGPVQSDLELVAFGKSLENEGLVGFRPAPLTSS